MIRQNRKDLPRDNPLDRVEVLRYDGDMWKGRVRTKTELGLEQTQQGSSDEVLVSTEGVEELKRNNVFERVKRNSPPIFQS